MTEYIVTWQHPSWRRLHTIILVVISYLLAGWISIQKRTLLLYLLWIIVIIHHTHHTHNTINSVHLILVKPTHLIVVDKSMRSPLQILLRLRIVVLYIWKSFWRVHASNCWLSVASNCRLSLPRHRLKLPNISTMRVHIIYSFLLCYFNLVFYIVMALVYVCHFLKSLYLILIISITTFRLSLIPIDDIKASWCI